MSSQFNSNSSASFGIGISNYNTSNNNVNNFLSGSSGCFSSAGSAAFNQFAAAGGCGGGPNFGPTPSGSGPTPNTTNIILQTLKRRANKNFVPLDERVTLERALGFTITSNTRLTQSSDGLIAYLAGCVIVLYDPTRQTQEFILSSARKTLTTVAFSHDGKLIATGESGHDPKVRVWDVREKTQVCEFGGHKFSIECVCFSTNPSSNLLVSIGSMHDMVVNVWNTRTRFKVASNKIACKVKGIAFARDGAYFVTVGNRHVKFWYLTTSSLMETVPLKGRAAILNEYKNSHFCDVVCGAGECAHYTYALTTNGLICEFEHESRSLRAVVELHTERAYCIYADLYNLFVGCANGAIHIYRQKSLDLIASLPRPHSLGVDVARFVDTRQLSSALAPHHADMAKYPDCVALCYNAFTLSAIYNDHSFYVWDIRDLSKVKKIDSHLFHSSCCFAVDTFNPSASWQPPGSYSIPVDSFITSSSDNTLRIWSPVTTSSSSYSPDSSTSSSSSNNRLKTNIYSKQLLKVIYIDNDLSALCDQTAILASSADNSDSQSTLSTNGSSNGQTSSSSNTMANTNLPISNITNFSSSDSNSLAPKLGARCLKINPFGNQLATGDRNGNIRIYDLTSPVGASGTLSSKAICMIEAHDGEILYLQYSQPESGRLLLASSSRDRLIHIFDASKLSYDLLQTLDDHSAAIMSVRFYFNSFERQLYVISCGADKSIMIRTTATPESQEFARQSYVVEKQTFHDLIVDESKSCINTISQDRMVRQYSIRDGKKLRQFKGSLNEDGYLLKMDMARNGSLLATSCTDKCVYVYDVNTGECVAYIYGHSEVVLDLKFTSDSQRLITVGGDGCIFIWKLSSLITQIANNTATSTSLSNSASVSQPVVSSTTTTSSRRPVIHTILSAPKQHPVNATLTISQQAAAQGQVPSPTPAVVVGGSASNSLVDSIFDADGLPEWARARISSFNQLSTTSRASTNQSSWSSSTNNSTYIDNTLSEYTSPSNYFQNQQQSQSQQQQPQIQQDKQQRRSRAVWGPPAQNTSFAIMLENESMLSNAGNNTSVVNNANTSLSFATDLNNKEDEDDEDNGAATSSEADDEVDESPAQTSGDIDETIITTTTGSVPFPSPRVDSDFTYPHSKQAKLNENVGSEKQQRFTWTQSIEDENRCCDDDGEKHEDDGETNKRQPIPSSTSSATTSSTDSIEEEEELIIVETTTTTTTTTRDVVANQEDEDQEPASSSSSSKSPPPRLFSPTKQQQQQEGVSQQPESSALSSPGDDEFHSPSSEIRSLTDKFYGSSENSDQTNNPTSSQTNLIDSIIKLNSDIESTIRRQSISARYLMKTQQQKQQQQHLQAGTPIVGLETGSQSQMRRENECGATSPVSSSSSSVSSSSSCLNETSSGKVTIRKIEDISGVINQALNNAAETNLEGHQKPIIEPRKSPTNSSSSTSSSSSIQMAASELMKMRRRSALLMGVPNSSSSSVSIPSHLATTESSLNKIKTKSTISAAQSSVGSGHLKRSPSASSLVASNEAAAAKSKDRPSVVNNKNISSSAKSSPTKCAPPANSSQVNNSQEASESGAGDGETQNGMKKAVSMISLMSNQPSVSSTSSTSSTSSSSSSTMTKTMPKSTSSSKPPLSSTSTMSSSSSSSTTLVNNANNAAGNMLPPKTVRQIKQRSAERQMTSSGLLTTSTTSATGAAASSSAFSRNSSINTFNEQNKHIRKLSSSIQNLHNQQQQQQQQQVPKDSNLPPQAPNRASSKSPQLHSSPSKQTKSSQQSGLGISHKVKSSSYRTLTTITKPNPINPPPQPQQQKQQQQQPEEEEPKREVVEISPEQPVEESQTSSEVPNNAVTNPYQNSSNSLTSSSSSSCSIFDSNLASGTSNPLDVDLVGSSASKCGADGGYRSASTTPNTCSSASSSTSTATTAILNTAATTVATASSGPFKKPVTFASLASHHAANALNLANSSSSGVSNRVGSHSASSMCDSITNVGNLIGGSGSSSSASPSPVHFHQEMADRIRCEFKQNFYHFHKQMLDESGKYTEQNTPTNDSSHHQYHRPYHLAGAVAAAANQTLTPLQALQFMHTFNTIYASTSQHNNNNNNRQQLKSSDLLVESTTSKETVDDETEIEMTA